MISITTKSPYALQALAELGRSGGGDTPVPIGELARRRDIPVQFLEQLFAVLRKGAHMTEFGLLWFLWWRALGYRHLGVSIAITLGYAATDEWHQTFVAGRHGSPWDWAIDAAGVGIAGLLVVVAARKGRWRPPLATASRRHGG